MCLCHIKLPYNISGGEERVFPLALFNGFLVGILVICYIYAVTLYPMVLFKKYKYKQPAVRKKQNQSADDSSISQCDNWITVISGNIEILHKFMRFLCRSFCVENMLFIIEIMQCKQEFVKTMCMNQEKEQLQSQNVDEDVNQTQKINYGVIIRLYDFEEEQKLQAIPRSTIVYGDNHFSLHEQIRMIYDKYIADTASLQVNISFNTKEIIQNVIFGNDNDDETMIQCLDEAIVEITSLLTSSLAVQK